MNYTQIVALDLEQCCWGGERNPGEIIQVGLAVLDLKTGGVLKTRSDYVSPVNDDISEYCTRLTGITAAKLRKSAKPLKMVLESIYQKIGSQNKIYVTWGDDVVVLQKYCQMWNIDFKFHNVINLSLLFHLHLQDDNVLRYSLEKALNYFGLSFQGKAHDASEDAKNTAILAHHFFKKTGVIK